MILDPHDPGVPCELSAFDRMVEAPLFDQTRRDRRGFDDPPGGALVPAWVPVRPLAPSDGICLTIPT